MVGVPRAGGWHSGSHAGCPRWQSTAWASCRAPRSHAAGTKTQRGRGGHARTLPGEQHRVPSGPLRTPFHRAPLALPRVTPRQPLRRSGREKGGARLRGPWACGSVPRGNLEMRTPGPAQTCRDPPHPPGMGSEAPGPFPGSWSSLGAQTGRWFGELRSRTRCDEEGSCGPFCSGRELGPYRQGELSCPLSGAVSPPGHSTVCTWPNPSCRPPCLRGVSGASLSTLHPTALGVQTQTYTRDPHPAITEGRRVRA